jgi:hypothetical protein
MPLPSRRRYEKRRKQDDSGLQIIPAAEIKKAIPALPAMGRILLKSSVKGLVKKTGYNCKKYLAQILGFLGAAMLSPPLNIRSVLAFMANKYFAFASLMHFAVSF